MTPPPLGLRIMAVLHFALAPLTAAGVYVLVAFLIMLPKLIQNRDYAHPFVAAWLAGGLGPLSRPRWDRFRAPLQNHVTPSQE